MKTPILIAILLSFLSFLKAPALLAREFDLGLLQSPHVQEASGIYRGEIRIQSANGQVDRPLKSQIEMTVRVSPDSIHIQSGSDLMGDRCRSKIHEIRELKKFPENDVQVLTADFSFDSGKCRHYSQLDTLTLIFWKNERNQMILETLFNHHLDKGETFSKKKYFLHGYFTKDIPSEIQKNKIPTVAKIHT